MLSDVFQGVKAYGQSFAIIRKYRLWKYVVLSGMISLLLGVGLFKLIWSYSNNIGAWLIGFYPFDFGRSVFETMIDYISGGILTILALLVYKYVVMVIVSPFMSLMSEEIERKLTNNTANSRFSIQTFVSDLIRGLRIAIGNLIKELGLTGLVLLIGLLPVVTFAVPVVIFIIQAYFAGFGNLDYYLERHANVSESKYFVNRNKGLAVGNGLVFLSLLLIPVAGLFLAPALGTTAATVEGIKRREQLLLR